MSRTSGRDPARRCLSVSEWPARDRGVWARALEPGDILEPGGERARHAPGSNRAVESGYGRWLGWLACEGLLDPESEPADRITPERVGAYLAVLAAQVSTVTQRRRLEELFIVARLADPARDWGWIRGLAARVRWRDRPTRDKRARLVGAEDLLALGHRLLAEATGAESTPPWRRALLYRDGLILALLAARPLRRANFTALRLRHHLVRRGGSCWIIIPAEETKTGTPIEVPWPEGLEEALAVYLAVWRPVLLARRVAWSLGAPEARDALWVSARGAALDTQGLYDAVTGRTRAAFGRPVNPHLFRYCAATSIAIEDPVHVRVASQVLGHRSLATTERHYNLARSVEAARGWQATLARLRGEAAAGYPRNAGTESP